MRQRFSETINALPDQLDGLSKKEMAEILKIEIYRALDDLATQKKMP
jgi:hypothetical protein